jgi:DMSO reductase anchor subunit
MLENTLKKIRLNFYLVFVLLILTGIIGSFLSKSISINQLSQTGITLQTISILMLLILTPTALKIYSINIETLKDIEDKNEKLKKYFFWSNIRLLMIASPLLINVLLYCLCKNNSMIFSAGISLIAIFFCKPQKEKMESELNTKEEL